MRERHEKILKYIDMYEKSRNKEESIKTLPFYTRFALEKDRQNDLKFQRKVTARIWGRIVELNNKMI